MQYIFHVLPSGTTKEKSPPKYPNPHILTPTKLGEAGVDLMKTYKNHRICPTDNKKKIYVHIHICNARLHVYAQKSFSFARVKEFDF